KSAPLACSRPRLPPSPPRATQLRKNAKHTQRRRLPSIRATMRSVRRRAGGMMKNAVVAAIGHAMKSQSKIEEGDEERDHAHHHARHQERQYQSGLGFHDRAPLISSAAASQRPAPAAILLNHSVRRPPAAAHPRQSLKKR